MRAFDDEPQSVAEINKFVAANGYAKDLSRQRAHHEIYLKDQKNRAAKIQNDNRAPD